MINLFVSNEINFLAFQFDKFVEIYEWQNCFVFNDLIEFGIYI